MQTTHFGIFFSGIQIISEQRHHKFQKIRTQDLN